MTMYQYKLLDKEAQITELWQNGVFVSEINLLFGNELLLYSLHSFYVELKYSGLKNSYAFVRSFCNTDQLAAYLNEIDISEISMI